MSIRDSLLSQLERFDDEAFATLANKGLLRRAYKDLETVEPCEVTNAQDTLVIAVGAHNVTFNMSGPAGARCDCPASSICQHILSAAIWLKRLSVDSNKTEDPLRGDLASDSELPTSPAKSLDAAHRLLSWFSYADLIKHGGKSGYRWAWQFVQDLDSESGLQISGEGYLVLSFRHPRITFRCMGDNIESIITDSKNTNIPKYRIAAILAYQKANGIVIQSPKTTENLHCPKGPDSKDYKTAHARVDESDGSRHRLLESVKNLLIECTELGLSHLSIGIYERYSTLAVWAQGATYPRLALLLRRMADHVELLLDRAGNADEHRLFEEITLAYGLVTALESAEQKNLSPASLIGRARSQYEPVNRLDLIGLGASPWRTASGYVGLTMVFWSLTDRCFLSCSDARPESQRGFNPITRYRASGPWSGLNSPAQATGHRIHLAGAQVNGLGRISASENCHATVQPIATAEELLNQLEICSQWSLLYQERATAKLSLLAEPEPMRDWVALKPERFGEAFFDQARQVLVWPLFDSGGLVILATLPYSEFNRYAMERIERLDMSALSRGSVLIARVRNSAVGLVADPLSLIMAESPNPANPVDALYFSDSFTSSLSPPHMERAIEDISHRTSGKGPYSTSPLIPPMLNEFRAWALRQAEKGTDHWTKTGAGIELQKYCLRFRTCGLIGFSQLEKNEVQGARAFLQSHYICMQYVRMLDNNPEETA